MRPSTRHFPAIWDPVNAYYVAVCFRWLLPAKNDSLRNDIDTEQRTKEMCIDGARSK